MNIIISGGGTGGHIFPAISIANAMRRRYPGVNILFVGAENRMEMEKVPDAGYPIVGLPVAGFDRKNLLKNIPVLLKLFRSMSKAKKIINDFRPDLVIGVGGYASGPVLKAAQQKGIPTLIQEQNSYAGVTNRMLAKKADAICVAYHGMEKFFQNDNIVLTGNPVRSNILDCRLTQSEAKEKLGFPADRPLVAVVGGSLGALTLNRSAAAAVDRFGKEGISFLWQTGKAFAEKGEEICRGKENIKAVPFVREMDILYRAADIFVSRAGASTISELQQVGVPTILVPSPNVAEDHQRHNAEALADRYAAVMIPDSECESRFADEVMNLIKDKEKLSLLRTNLIEMGKECAAADERIIDTAAGLLDKNNRK